MAAPFRVEQSWNTPGQWKLFMNAPRRRLIGIFSSPGQAIDYAYKNWPWWP